MPHSRQSCHSERSLKRVDCSYPLADAFFLSPKSEAYIIDFSFEALRNLALILALTCWRMSGASKTIWTCSRCLRSQQRLVALAATTRAPRQAFSSASPHDAKGEKSKQDGAVNEEKDQGALSRRLSEMAEETMDTGSKSDRTLMQDMAFSDDLKKQLEERIAQTSFKAENQQAFSQASLPVCPIQV